MEKFCHEQFQTRSLQYQCTYQVWWKSIDINWLSYGNENTDVWRAKISVKKWRNVVISKAKQYLHNISAHTKFGLDPLIFSQVIVRKRTYRSVCGGQIIDANYPSAIPNQISTIAMHIQSLDKIHWHLLKLSSGNEIGRWTDGRAHGH